MYLLIGLLLYLVLRNVPLAEVWEAVRRLQLWQIMLLLGLNLCIYMLIALRWWIIVRAENQRIAYLPLVLVSIAVFGVSYFTFGPHVGGEPLQVIYLQRHYGLTYTRATASVIMDKLLELLANFFLLAVGLTAVIQAGILSRGGTISWPGLTGLVILCLWPPVHIILLYYGRHPVSAALGGLPLIRRNSRIVRFVAASERMAGSFCRRHFPSLLLATAVSLCAGTGMVGEFALIAGFLHIQLPFWQTIAAWTAGWLALLAPLPGGLGALEASEVYTLGMFGVSAASALGVTLTMRSRDLLIGGIGLLIASGLVGRGRAWTRQDRDSSAH